MLASLPLAVREMLTLDLLVRSGRTAASGRAADALPRQRSSRRQPREFGGRVSPRACCQETFVRLRLVSTLALAAVVAVPSMAGAQFDNSIPVRNLTGSAPMVVTETSVFFPQPPNGKVRVCVSFRNVTAKPAAEDRVHVPL